MLLLIQAGGLGYMTFSTLVGVALGRRITLQERQTLVEGLNALQPGGGWCASRSASSA